MGVRIALAAAAAVTVALVTLAVILAVMHGGGDDRSERFLQSIPLDAMSCMDMLAARFPDVHRMVGADASYGEVVDDLVRGYSVTQSMPGSSPFLVDANVCVMKPDKRAMYGLAIGTCRTSADGSSIRPAGCVYDPSDAGFALSLAAAHRARHAREDAFDSDLEASNALLADQIRDRHRSLVGVQRSVSTVSNDIVVRTSMSRDGVRDASSDFATKFLRMSDTSGVASMPGCVIQKSFGGVYYTMAMKYASAARNDPYALWMGSLGRDVNVEDLGSFDADAFLRDTREQYRSDAVIRALVTASAASTVIVETYRVDGIVSTLKFTVTAQDDLQSWFCARNLLDSSIAALNHADQSFQFFSMRGHDDLGRRFFICHRYNGCDNDDGAFVIPTRSDVCPWDRDFAYLAVTAKDRYTTFGRGNRREDMGDRVVLWIKSNEPNDPLQSLGGYASHTQFLTLPFAVRDTSADGLDAKYPNAFAIDPSDAGAQRMREGLTTCAHFKIDGLPQKLYLREYVSNAWFGKDVVMMRATSAPVFASYTTHVFTFFR